MPPLYFFLVKTSLIHQALAFLTLEEHCRLDSAVAAIRDVRAAFLRLLPKLSAITVGSDRMPTSEAALLWIRTRRTRLTDAVVDQPTRPLLQELSTMLELFPKGLGLKYTDMIPYVLTLTSTGISSAMKAAISRLSLTHSCAAPTTKGAHGLEYHNFLSIEMSVGVSLRPLQAFPNLKELELKGNLPLATLVAAPTVAQLTKLTLEGTMTAAELQAILKRCQRMEQLTVSVVGGEIDLYLCDMDSQYDLSNYLGNLETIALFSINVPSTGMASLVRASPRLRSITIPSGTVMSSTLAAWGEAHASPTVLCAKWRVQMASFVHANAKTMVHLRALSLTGVDRGVCCVEAVVVALTYTRQLQSLCFEHGSLTQELTSALAISCPKLRSMRITNCVCEIASAESCAFAVGHPLLEEIVLCCPVTDAIALALAEHCPRLVTVELAGQCLTDTSVSTLATQCPRLESLILRQATALTAACLDTVMQNCPHLRRLETPIRAVTRDTRPACNK